MSYVLDALKKMEHEKVRKARGVGMTSITGDLFSNDRQHHAEGSRGKIVLITIFVALVTFGATWFFLKPPPPGLSVKSPATAVVMDQKTLPIPEPLPPVVQSPVKPAHVESPTSASAVPAVVAPQQKAVTAQQPARGAEDAAALITLQELKKRTKEQKKPTAPVMAPPADIKLSGIAWQDDHLARRAVINGFLMQEGSSISGARVTEILQDRVRFSQSGSVFEISLAASAGISQTGK